MIAITGITGRIGGQLADRLLAAGVSVRAVVRNARKAEQWTAKGCQFAVADLSDAVALTEAFRGAEAVFILPPPVYDPDAGFQKVYTMMTALREAVRKGGVGKVLYLSTVGAQAEQTNLLSLHTIGESILSQLDIPVTFLRPAWFIENIAWDIPDARDKGVIKSFLQPLDRPLPMVAIHDISELAAELIQESWTGPRIVEIEGPSHVAPLNLGRGLSKVFDREVKVELVPRDSWESQFVSQGARNPYPRIRMLDGFNEGWITFEHPASVRKGSTTIETVLSELSKNPSI